MIAFAAKARSLFWRAESEPLEWPQPAAVLIADRSVLGEHAKRLLDDPVLTLAFDKLREDLAVAWRNTKADDTESRERAYFMQWALEGVRGKLQALLNDAKVIEAEQKRKEADASR